MTALWSLTEEKLGHLVVSEGHLDGLPSLPQPREGEAAGQGLMEQAPDHLKQHNKIFYIITPHRISNKTNKIRNEKKIIQR